ncbi:hypothetical protein KEM52_004290 [Ascosphaera acerosa]|nr:hypothetical protein KEM52_004290 [Ascosphaera acerosa]
MGYSIVEPHPSAARAMAIHTSRGGAGNICSLKNTTTTPGPTAQGPPSLTRLDSRAPSKYYSAGRGGAGNVRHCAVEQRPIFSFDEELELAAKREQSTRRGAAPVFTAVGRGGAGNLVAPPERAEQLRQSFWHHAQRHQRNGGASDDAALDADLARRSSSASSADTADALREISALQRLQSNSSTTSSVASRTSSFAGSVKHATKKGFGRVFSH